MSPDVGALPLACPAARPAFLARGQGRGGRADRQGADRFAVPGLGIGYPVHLARVFRLLALPSRPGHRRVRRPRRRTGLLRRSQERGRPGPLPDRR